MQPGLAAAGPRNAEDLHRVALPNLQGEYGQVCLSAELL